MGGTRKRPAKRMSEFRDAALLLFATLHRMGITYAVGGSIASSLHGIARATQDLDVVVGLAIGDVAEFHAAIREAFYADDEAMRNAIRRGMSFNLIHFESGFKFDLFVASRHPLGGEQLARSQEIESALLGGEAIRFPVISAEDIVLVKLLWYRDGGEVSERQWNDLVNLATVQSGRLDGAYLETEAARLGVADLLRRLMA